LQGSARAARNDRFDRVVRHFRRGPAGLSPFVTLPSSQPVFHFLTGVHPGLVKDRITRGRVMNGLEFVLAGMSLVAAYGGSYFGERLLNRFGV
jgi:hypothetical protein